MSQVIFSKRTWHILLLTFTSGSFQISQHQTHYMMMIHIKQKPSTFLIFALVRHKQDHKFQKKTFFWESNLVGADGLWEIAGRRRRDSPTAAGEGNVDKDLGGIQASILGMETGFTLHWGGRGAVRIMEARSERRINNKMNEKKLFNVEREKWECLKETKWYDGWKNVEGWMEVPGNWQQKRRKWKMYLAAAMPLRGTL